MGDLAVDEADADGRTVDTRLEETLEDCFVEFGVGAAGEESVELDEEKQVHVLRGRGLAVTLAVTLADVVAFWKVNTLQSQYNCLVKRRKEWHTIVWWLSDG